MGARYSKSKSQPPPRASSPPSLPPSPQSFDIQQWLRGQHRRSTSRTGSCRRARASSNGPTPPILQGRDYDDGCRSFRRTLGAVHKICKPRSGQISAVSQSLGQTAGEGSPDCGLAAHVQRFDDSVKTLYRRLSLDSHHLHIAHPPREIKDFADALGRLAVDVELWQKEFTRLVFPNMAHGLPKKLPYKLRWEARSLGRRCFVAVGKLDTLSNMTDGQASASSNHLGTTEMASDTTLETPSRPSSPVMHASWRVMHTPSPVMHASSRGGVASSRRGERTSDALPLAALSASAIGGSSPQASAKASARGVGMIGLVG